MAVQRILYWCLFGSLLCGGIIGWAVRSTHYNAGDGRRVTFDAVEHDFGVIEPGKAKRCEFRFANAGTSPISVASVRPDCGCVAEEYDRKPIMPGARSVIAATLTTAGAEAPDEIIKHLVVRFDDQQRDSPTILTLRGNLQPPIIADPHELTFRTSRSQPEAVATLTVKRTLMEKVRFAAIRLIPPRSYYKIKEVGRTADNVEFLVSLNTKTVSAYPWPLNVVYSDSAGIERMLVVPVQGAQVTENLEPRLVPAQYFKVVPALASGERVGDLTNVRFRLVSSGDSRLAITGVDFDVEDVFAWKRLTDDGFELWIHQLPKRRYLLSKVRIQYEDHNNHSHGSVLLEATVFFQS